MNFKSIVIAAASFASLAGAAAFGLPVSPNGPQVAKDRADIKTQNAEIAADTKEVKRLSDLLTQATARTHQAHDVFLQKVTARNTAIKSFGGKDPRADQASKDEAAAKQEWAARSKEEQDIAAQRKAAIQKLHSADLARIGDVRKVEAEEGHPAAPPKK